MAQHYGIKKASEMLAISEKEVFEAIQSGMLPARFENDEWHIPEWGIKAYLRTRKLLDRIEGRVNSKDDLSHTELLQTILSRVELILEQSQQENIILELIKQNGELTAKLIKLEEELRKRDAEIERLKSDFLNELVRREDSLKQSFYEERRELENRILDLERKLSLRKSRDEVFQDYLTPDRTSESSQERGFWRRLVKMLTWD